MISEMLSLEQQNFTFVGQGTKLKGEFQMLGVIKIAGVVEGPIDILEQGQLSIERTGYVKGDLNCYDLEIFGHFRGNLKSQGKVVVWPSAHVNGKVEARHLVIYPGATLNIEGHTS